MSTQPKKERIGTGPDRVLREKEIQLVEALPKYNWDTTKAGLAVGYSNSYSTTRLPIRVRTDPALSKAVAQKRKQVALRNGWNRDKWLAEAEATYRDARARNDGSTAGNLLRQIGQAIGVFEEDNKQKQGDSLAALAKCLVEARTQPQLEGEVAESGVKCIDATVIDSNEGYVDINSITST